MRLDKIDANKILRQLLSSGSAAGIAGGPVGGLLASTRGRMLGRKTVELGGLAAVAGLAWIAWDRYRGCASGARAGVGAPVDSLGRATLAGFLPPVREPGRANELSLTLVRAMIAAAHADGKLDGREGDAIFDAVDRLELGADEKRLLLEELGRPVDVDELVAAAKTPAVAAEIYTAALLAFDGDSPAKRAWLAMLAARLGLPERFVAQLDGRANAETESVRATA